MTGGAGERVTPWRSAPRPAAGAASSARRGQRCGHGAGARVQGALHPEPCRARLRGQQGGHLPLAGERLRMGFPSPSAPSLLLCGAARRARQVLYRQGCPADSGARAGAEVVGASCQVGNKVRGWPRSACPGARSVLSSGRARGWGGRSRGCDRPGSPHTSPMRGRRSCARLRLRSAPHGPARGPATVISAGSLRLWYGERALKQVRGRGRGAEGASGVSARSHAVALCGRLCVLPRLVLRLEGVIAAAG